MVRMSDIAEKLGISTVSVSKALAGKDGVSDSLREQVVRTAEEMGYRKRKRYLSNETYTIGILMTKRLQQPEHSFYLALGMRMAEQLKTNNYYNMLEVIREDQEATLALPDFAEQGLVDGILVLGAVKQQYLERLKEFGIPLVLVDFYEPELSIPSVIPDSYYGAFEVTRTLLQMGHRRIGFLGSPHKNNNAADKYFGYSKAMQKYNGVVNNRWIVDNRDEQGSLLEHIPLPEQLPTAFFCDNDQSAYYFMQDLQRQGYRIPQDISIAGFYDHIFASLAVPQLTTYRVDIDVMAHKAVGALLKLIGGVFVPSRVIVSGCVVERSPVLDIRNNRENAR